MANGTPNDHSGSDPTPQPESSHPPQHPQAYPPPSYPPTYPPAQQYGQPPYVQTTNGMATASLVLGIAGLTVFIGIGSILALVFGYIGKNQIEESNGLQGGSGIALAGIVMGWIGVALGILFIVMLIAGLWIFAENAPEIFDELEDLVTPTPTF